MEYGEASRKSDNMYKNPESREIVTGTQNARRWEVVGSCNGQQPQGPLRAADGGKWPRSWGLVRTLENVLGSSGSY